MNGWEEFNVLRDYIKAHARSYKESGDKIVFSCLFHDDATPSASMKIGRSGQPISYCSVCGKIHSKLKKSAGLWREPHNDTYSSFEKFLYFNKVCEYDYVDFSTGVYLFTRFRLRDKKQQGFPVGRKAGNRVVRGIDGADTSKAVFCNGQLTRLKEAIAKGDLVAYTEGEKDCLGLWKAGFVSFTCGGVRTFKESLLPHLRGGRFVVFGDNDVVGKQDAERITGLLNTVGSATMVIPPDVPEHGDVSDFLESHSREELEQLIETVVTEKTVAQTVKPKQSLINKLIELKAAERFAANDKGSAELFAAVFKDVSRYNPTQKDFMFYSGIKWEPDVEGMKARRNAKKLADALLTYAVRVSDMDEERRREYLKYAARLTSYRDRTTMVNDSRDLNFFDNTQLDADDYLLNCKNCVLDLSGDTPKVMEHDPDLLMSKVCGASYDPAARCDLWERTVAEIMQNDSEKIKYLQKIFGIALTGDCREEQMYILYGATSRNGKSTITETALSLLGDYAATITPETLAVKQNKDSRTASPDIAKLAGVRLVVASEPPKRMLFDTSLIKTLTGRDTVTARFLHQNEFSFKPKFKLLLNTNYLPSINDNTVFRSERIRVISFDKHFTEDEQNKCLKSELRKKLAGILNWAVEGLYLYRKEGLTPPVAIRSATSEYEVDSDKIQRFISECLVRSAKNMAAKAAYDAYSKWCDESGCGTENKQNFFSELRTRGIFAASGTVDGKTVKNIIRGYELAGEGFAKVDDDSPLPFD